MLYVLLVIIAIGVLLASEAGQAFLGLLIKLAVIAGICYLAFWIIVLAIGLLSDKSTRDSLVTILGVIMLIGYAGYGIYTTHKKYQRGEFRKEIIQNKAKQLWLKNWNEGIGNKIAMVFVISAFSVIAIMLILSFTNGFWQQ